GDQGADRLVGGPGRDLLLGGSGADVLQGEDGDDILVGGTLRFDSDIAKLAAIRAEWTRTDLAYQPRIDHCRTGGGLDRLSAVPVLLNAANAPDDDGLDTLKGGEGQDWFWGTMTGNLVDLVTDLAAAERLR